MKTVFYLALVICPFLSCGAYHVAEKVELNPEDPPHNFSESSLYEEKYGLFGKKPKNIDSLDTEEEKIKHISELLRPTLIESEENQLVESNKNEKNYDPQNVGLFFCSSRFCSLTCTSLGRPSGSCSGFRCICN